MIKKYAVNSNTGTAVKYNDCINIDKVSVQAMVDND